LTPIHGELNVCEFQIQIVNQKIKNHQAL